VGVCHSTKKQSSGWDWNPKREVSFNAPKFRGGKKVTYLSKKEFDKRKDLQKDDSPGGIGEEKQRERT